MTPNHTPTDRGVLVTGGSSGIGAATARLAARRNYAVCVNYRLHHEEARALVSTIEQESGRAIAVQADISSEPDILRLFETVDRQLGRLTALVNKAATLEAQMRVESVDAARLQRIFTTNVIGSFLCAREAVKRMSTRHGGLGGSIVNVSSVAARLGSPAEYADYAR